MKLLYYSWSPYRDEHKRGGGAASYLDRVIDELAAGGEHSIVTLSSGTEYDPLSRSAYCRAMPTINGVRRYAIVNSPVLAPAHMNTANTGTAASDTATRDLLQQLIVDEGPFDVVHFNNLEGISLRALDIKDRWPESRIVVSLHDYYLICPQVKLWQDGSHNCTGADKGRNCVDCQETRAAASALVGSRKLLRPLVRSGLVNPRTEQRLALGASLYLAPLFSSEVRAQSRRNGKPLSPVLAERQREQQVERFNSFLSQAGELVRRKADLVLAVSNRVHELALRRGLADDNLVTEYIGTRFPMSRDVARPARSGDRLCIGFLGFASAEKGFFFLLDALEQLDAGLAAKLDLVVAARAEGSVRQRIEALGARLNSVTHHNGYQPDALPDILAPINLGIVPVLWEDNLPQVTLEFAAHGVPVLTSDLGGAQEVGNTGEFVFRAGDAADFADRLGDILTRYDELADRYFASLRCLPTIAEHINRLTSHYSAPTTENTGNTGNTDLVREIST